jgi:hypothetical protein
MTRSAGSRATRWCRTATTFSQSTERGEYRAPQANKFVCPNPVLVPKAGLDAAAAASQPPPCRAEKIKAAICRLRRTIRMRFRWPPGDLKWTHKLAATLVGALQQGKSKKSRGVFESEAPQTFSLVLNSFEREPEARRPDE